MPARSKKRANPLLSQVGALRADAEWTRVQLAVYAGVAPGTLDKIEAAEQAGDHEPLEGVRASTWRKLAEALQVPLSRLVPWYRDF